MELSHPEAVAARAQQAGSAARTRTGAAAIITGLSQQQTNQIDNTVARNWRRMHTVQANGNTQFQNDEEQRQQRENQRITQDGAYARYAQMVINNHGTMLTPSEWLARGRPQL
jgi:poly(3-hydroxybutyrate) depolymerase